MLLWMAFPAIRPHGTSMKRVALYSTSNRQRGAAAAPAPAPATESRVEAAPDTTPVESTPPAPRQRRRVRSFLTRHSLFFGITAGALFALLLVFAYGSFTPAPHVLTQKDIDAAVLRTLET